MSTCTACTPSQLDGNAGWVCTTIWLRGIEGVLDQVIFPSFCSNLFNLLICLCLTFIYLNSLTLSINSWHSSIEVEEIMDATCDLHKSLCLALLSRRLLMDLALACKRSLSAFLMIFLAFSVWTVFFNMMLTGVITLLIHLRVNI